VGTFCGIGKYRRELRAAEKKAVRKKALKDVETLLEEARNTRASCPLPDEEAVEGECARQSTEALMERANLDCRALLQISKRSGNLKGTCQRGITDAVASLRQTMLLLGSENRSEETKGLEEEVRALREVNATLQRDLLSVKKRLEAMEREGRRRRRVVVSDSSPSPPRRRHLSSSASEEVGGVAPPSCLLLTTPRGWGAGRGGRGGTGASVSAAAHAAPPVKTYASATRSTGEEDDARTAAILRKVGTLVDGRLAAVFDRLPPEPPGKFRPPLKRDGGKKKPSSHSAPPAKGNKKASPGAAGGDAKAPPQPPRRRNPWPLRGGEPRRGALVNPRLRDTREIRVEKKPCPLQKEQRPGDCAPEEGRPQAVGHLV